MVLCCYCCTIRQLWRNALVNVITHQQLMVTLCCWTSAGLFCLVLQAAWQKRQTTKQASKQTNRQTNKQNKKMDCELIDVARIALATSCTLDLIMMPLFALVVPLSISLETEETDNEEWETVIAVKQSLLSDRLSIAMFPLWRLGRVFHPVVRKQ